MTRGGGLTTRSGLAGLESPSTSTSATDRHFVKSQTHRFGILRVSSHNGRLTVYCKTTRKNRNNPTEYLILSLSGIIHDSSSWFKHSGIPPGSEFLTGDFEGPTGRNHECEQSLRDHPQAHNPMLLKQLDLSVGHILHRLPGKTPVCVLVKAGSTSYQS